MTVLQQRWERTAVEWTVAARLEGELEEVRTTEDFRFGTTIEFFVTNQKF